MTQKAPHKDNICDELNRNGGLEWWKEIQALIAIICINEIMPEDWHTTIIWPVHKIDDQFECSNYMGISLWNMYTLWIVY
jgi:hypothetical protein